MPPTGPRKELDQLRRFVAEIDARFLAPHIAVPTLEPPSRQEQLDVAAFVVLAHGALENFVEGLAHWALTRVEKNWLKKRASRSTATLLMGVTAPEDFGEVTSGVFDLVRVSIEEAKSVHSTSIQLNNGVATKHLRTLLLPVGIDIPTDPALASALDLLVKLRHDWAHQYRFGAKTIRSAQDVRTTAGDCLELASRLSKNATLLRL